MLFLYKKRETKKRDEDDAEEIEVIAIRYDINDSKHPNYAFHKEYDTCPLENIINFGDLLEKKDVS